MEDLGEMRRTILFNTDTVAVPTCRHDVIVEARPHVEIVGAEVDQIIRVEDLILLRNHPPKLPDFRN